MHGVWLTVQGPVCGYRSRARGWRHWYMVDGLQGYLTDKKHSPPRTLQLDYT